MIPRRIPAALITARKELKDFFRDPRSIILTLVLPVVLFPLLFRVLEERSPEASGRQRIFTIGLSGEVPDFLSRTDPGYFVDDIDEPAAAENDTERRRLLFSRYDAVVISESGTVYYNNADPESEAAVRYLQEASGSMDGKKKQLQGDSAFSAAPLYRPEDAAGKLFLSLVLPFMVFIFASTCPLPVAADMSAGEKERLSLEPLLCTAAPRSGIISGKLLAAALAGCISVGAYFLGISISVLISPEILGDEAMIFNIDPSQYLLILTLMLLATSFFAALELTAGFMARSVREAQLLGMPLLFVSMGAVYIAQSIDLQHVPLLIPHIPLVNLGLVIREAALDRVNPYHASAAILWSLFYLFCAAFASVHRFKHESVIGGR
ncbi:ABC transporter permease [Marispirochaeta aestuarii]|nr:ABC transporter permease subunit [Marispirochaeta aestuarii]